MATIKQEIGSTTYTLFTKGRIWYVRIWLNDEKIDKKETLGTDDFETAKRLGANRVMAIMGAKAAGQRLMGITVAELLSRFVEKLQLDVYDGHLRETTLATQSQYLKTGWKFLAAKLPQGLNTRVSGIQGTIWREFPRWAEENAKAKGRPTLRKDVILMQLQVIKKAFTWALEHKHCTDMTIPNWGELRVEKQRSFSKPVHKDQWFNAVKVFADAIGKQKTEVQKYNHAMLYFAFLTMSVSGLRVGEMFQLRNRNVRLRDDGRCAMEIGADTSKHGTSREVTTLIFPDMEGDPLRVWLNKHQIHKDPDHFVFSLFDGSKTSTAEENVRSLRRDLKTELNAVGAGHVLMRKGRHNMATELINLGINPLELVKMMATSVKMLEQTYFNSRNVNLFDKVQAALQGGNTLPQIGSDVIPTSTTDRSGQPETTRHKVGKP